ncbi:hypothetical protein L1887_59906 [Cichorium endivia]|nr:hypothetical protein L1887_59906 [Cichorium endivia]
MMPALAFIECAVVSSRGAMMGLLMAMAAAAGMGLGHAQIAVVCRAVPSAEGIGWSPIRHVPPAPARMACRSSMLDRTALHASHPSLLLPSYRRGCKPSRHSSVAIALASVLRETASIPGHRHRASCRSYTHRNARSGSLRALSSCILPSACPDRSSTDCYRAKREAEYARAWAEDATLVGTIIYNTDSNRISADRASLGAQSSVRRRRPQQQQRRPPSLAQTAPQHAQKPLFARMMRSRRPSCDSKLQLSICCTVPFRPHSSPCLYYTFPVLIAAATPRASTCFKHSAWSSELG